MSKIVHPPLPARPLAAMVDRTLARATGGMNATEGDARAARAAVYAMYKLSPRVLWSWRNNPGALVQFDVADRIISASPYLWFDVWQECPRDPEHQVALMDSGTCSRCEAHERARFAFTGERPARRRAA